MTKKKGLFSAGLNTLCALIWTVNFLISWLSDGWVNTSTALFGAAALMFAVAAVGSWIAFVRMPDEFVDLKEEK